MTTPLIDIEIIENQQHENRTPLLFIAILSSAGLKAQEVISSSGNYSVSPADQSWSLGEVTVFTISGGDVQVDARLPAAHFTSSA
ncbi:MAG: hypothetical protein IPL49_18005 [Saprospirales bacterium]|nr:hypothetical protein [Saprospirales bacterium]